VSDPLRVLIVEDAYLMREGTRRRRSLPAARTLIPAAPWLRDMSGAPRDRLP
jgi:hypothetical protein